MDLKDYIYVSAPLCIYKGVYSVCRHSVRLQTLCVGVI